MGERSNGGNDGRPHGDDTSLNHPTEERRGPTPGTSQPLHQVINIESNACGEGDICVDDLLQVITNELKDSAASLQESRTANNVEDMDGPFIFRVPEYLGNNDKTAYAPNLFAFGPYHHSDQNLPYSEYNKKYYVLNANIQSKKEIMDRLLQSRKQARKYYDGDINMADKDFVLMLFRDACCILHVFGTVPHVAAKKENRQSQRCNQDATIADTSVGNGQLRCCNSSRSMLNLFCNACCTLQASCAKSVPHGIVSTKNEQSTDGSVRNEQSQGINSMRMFSAIIHDLILLENQVPFFILKKFHEIECPATDATDMLQKAVDYVHMIMGYLSPRRKMPLPHGEGAHHFLHLCHIYISPRIKDEKEVTNEKIQIQWHRAVEYRGAGVRLKKKELGVEESLLNIEFKHGMLLIPCFVIDEKVNFIFRNLLAFEQCTRIADHVTAYIIFMSHLVNKPEDVALLCEKGIIQNHIGGEEEVSKLFVNLSHKLMFDPQEKNYLKSLSVNLEKHYRSRVSTWWAWLRHKHNNPWLILGALFILLTAFSTLVQLVYHFRKPSKT